MHDPRRKQKQRWSPAEVAAVMRHFKDSIKKGKLATKNQCQQCKAAEHPVLANRTVQNIRDFVRNRGRSLRKKSDKWTATSLVFELVSSVHVFVAELPVYCLETVEWITVSYCKCLILYSVWYSTNTLSNTVQYQTLYQTLYSIKHFIKHWYCSVW